MNSKKPTLRSMQFLGLLCATLIAIGLSNQAWGVDKKPKAARGTAAVPVKKNQAEQKKAEDARTIMEGKKEFLKASDLPPPSPHMQDKMQSTF